jgi:hypothetical protein
MKTKSFAVNVSGAAVAALCLFGACLPQTSNAQPDSAPPPPDGSAVTIAPDDSAALPPGVLPSSPLAEVIKLTQAGISEDVITAYVNNSTSLFNLNSDQIIYLKDIGVPDAVVQAMIQRDQVLQSQITSRPQPAPAPDTTVVATTDVAPPPTVVTVDYFYDTLAPYGTWVDVEGYGRCWRPTVVVGNAGWQPYGDRGHWVWTDDGWYWISDYSWGWAPFHYGRWFHHERFGWCWYPDTVWAPSWVTWRYADDYCGWAPLPPRCDYREGVGFFYNGAAVSIGFDFGLGVGAFTFVHTRDFCDPHPWRHRVESREVTQVFNRTTVINNFDVDREHRTFINHGIDPQHITEVTHAPIRPIAIHEATGRVPRGEQLGRDGRSLMVNRPHFSDNPARSGQGGPQHVTQPAPAAGSPYQPSHNGNENRNSQPPGHNQATTPPSVVGSPYQPPHNGNANDNSQPRRNQPAPAGPEIGSPFQPSHNGNQNNNSQPPHNGQPVQTAPVPGQRQFPPVTNPGHNDATPPAEHSTSPGNRSAPVTPVQPSAPNYNSTDNRRYPSPHMQQGEPQNPGVRPGNSGGRVGASVTPQAPVNPPGANRFSPPPAQPPQPQHNFSAPATPPSPPVRQPDATHFNPPVQPPPTAQPLQRDYVSPRNQTPPSESRPNYSQPPAQGNQSPGASAPASPPAQSQQPQQSQRSGKGKNQNGQ